MSTDRPTLTESRSMFCRCNRRLVLALPAPEETWTVRDVDDPVASDIRRMTDNGIIRRAGYDVEQQLVIWRTDGDIYRWVQLNLDRISETPCGRGGIRNLGGGEFTCCDDGCDCRFDRATAEEVMS